MSLFLGYGSGWNKFLEMSIVFKDTHLFLSLCLFVNKYGHYSLLVSIIYIINMPYQYK